jgi:hypothetical protein
MSSAQARNENWRFKSEKPRDPLANYELIRMVATKAAERVNATASAGAVPVAPDEVTERASDEARPHVKGYKNIPTARHMCTLLPVRSAREQARGGRQVGQATEDARLRAAGGRPHRRQEADVVPGAAP